MTLPNLKSIATTNLVEKIGASGFQASYINWSRTMQLLRDNAPGWLPELVESADGGILHRSPVGAFLLIRFVHSDGTKTPAVPQAIMDTRNNAVAFEKITARDVTDTHVRGICKAAALHFGLAYELWAKMPLESGYAPDEGKPEGKVVTPTDGVWDSLDSDTQIGLEQIKLVVADYMAAGDAAGAWRHIAGQKLGTDEKAGLRTLLDSKTRTALKKAADAAKEPA